MKNGCTVALVVLSTAVSIDATAFLDSYRTVTQLRPTTAAQWLPHGHAWMHAFQHPCPPCPCTPRCIATWTEPLDQVGHAGRAVNMPFHARRASWPCHDGPGGCALPHCPARASASTWPPRLRPLHGQKIARACTHVHASIAQRPADAKQYSTGTSTEGQLTVNRNCRDGQNRNSNLPPCAGKAQRC